MQPANTDSNLAKGMDLALTLLVFLLGGYFLDRWLGTAPVFTIAMILVAAVGQFIRLKHTYNATMEQLEAARREAAAARTAAGPTGGSTR